MIEFLSALVAEDVVLVNHTTAVVAMVNLFFLLFCFHEIKLFRVDAANIDISIEYTKVFGKKIFKTNNFRASLVIFALLFACIPKKSSNFANRKDLPSRSVIRRGRICNTYYIKE